MNQYLGDSVYLELDHGMLKLMTDNGFGPSNIIYLDPEVYNALVQQVNEQFVVTDDVRFVERKLE